MKIIIHGFGKMGQMVLQAASTDEDVEVVAIVDSFFKDELKNIPVYKTIDEVVEDVDVIIDYSHPSLLRPLLDFSTKKNIRLVLATTGYSNEDLDLVKECSSKIAIFQSYNMSIGISIVNEILELITPKLSDTFDIEIVEKHHNRKIDAPSGTAKLLYDTVSKHVDNCESIYDRSNLSRPREKNEVGMHAIRGGTIFGEHSIIFAGDDEIIEIKHEALSKKVFAQGSIKAGKIIMGKESGLFNLKTLYK